MISEKTLKEVERVRLLDDEIFRDLRAAYFTAKTDLENNKNAFKRYLENNATHNTMRDFIN